MKYLHQKVIVTLMFLILGFTMVLQFKNEVEDYSFVSIRTMADLQSAVDREKEEITNLKERINTNENKLQEYQQALQDEGSIKEVLRNELEAMKLVSGFVDVEGSGIILRLSDSDRELYEGENPNNLIIHDGDVLTILNDLRIAGAEVLSINGQRLLSTSEIKCAGPTITINNHTYGQPFVIKAIGDPETLSAAVRAPGTYASSLKEIYGLNIESYVSERVRVARFQDHMTLQYVTTLRKGE
ncbi:MAG: DUF881 domain-containing protein [Clostridiaceae bacterium]|nr:DUF881 domain-containing protein [Clostridiaceae bacterium]